MMKIRMDLDEIVKKMKLPFKPVDLQMDDIMKAYYADRFAFFYAVGGGKTFVSTAVALLWEEPHTTIICPPILLPQWEAWLHSIGEKDTSIFSTPKRKVSDLNHKWVIMSHAIFRDSFIDILGAFKGKQANLIVDECFPAGTLVTAADGQNKPIESFKVGDLVLTSEGPRAILKVFQSLAFQLIDLELSNGTRIRCTPHHPVFTDLGWLAAQDCQGRRLLHVSHLSDVRYGIQEEDELTYLCGQEHHTNRAHLLKALRDESSSRTLPRAIRGSRHEAARKSCNRPEGSGSSQGTSYGLSSAVSVGESEKLGTSTFGEGRQRNGYDPLREVDRPHSRVPGLSVELLSLAGQQTGGLPNELQTGFCTPNKADRDRSGWIITQYARQKTSRSEKDSYVGVVRVESISHQQHANPEPVWNFEVGGCPHYFAGDILVHNCQALKNPQSKLFKNVNTFISPDRRILLLTATPTSKPQDTYTYMRLKTPTVYRSYGHWQNLHVGSVDIFGAITQYKNLEVLADNFSLKAATRDKKELFGDDLGAVYQPMIYDLSPQHLALYNRLAEEQLLLLDNGEKIDATSAQRLRHALQQIVINYAKFSGKETDKASGLDLLDEIISQVDPMDKSKSKFIVWTYYKATSSLVTDYLRKQFGEQAVVAAYGGVNSAKSVQSIMFDDNCRILVAQPSSVGVGLNLQHNCSEALWLEQATTPMMTKQSAGRIARTGQKVKPTLRFAQARGTIQVKLFQDLLRNDELVNQVEKTPKTLRQEIFGL